MSYPRAATWILPNDGRRGLSAILMLGALTSGCGSDTSNGSGVAVNMGGSGSGASPSVSGNGGSSVGPTGSSGSATSAGGIDLSGSLGGNGAGGTTTETIDPNAACAKATASAKLSSVNMFVMFDRSSSMNQAANQNGTRWQLTSTALNAFFASPEAAGLRLALRFFPHDQPAAGCDQTGCNINACAAPLVELAALTADSAPTDTQEAALISATMASGPVMMSQGTPIYAALGGALQRASVQHQQTPEEKSVVVLVTDGEPNGCDTDVGHIAQLAATALANDGTLTYAIGLTGSREADMDQIAIAGGTQKGIFISDGATTSQELIDALAAIRGQVLDCDFALPQPAPGVEVDKDRVNINYTPKGGQTTTLKQVADIASCSANGGWYYDNPAQPTRIILCQSTCDGASGDLMATLDILLGCETAVEVPE